MKKEIMQKYREYFRSFSCNSYGLEVGDRNLARHFTWFRIGGNNKFLSELVEAIGFCARNGVYDILYTAEGIHEKTEKFIEALYDNNNPRYQALRDEGIEDIDDIMLYISTFDRVNVKSEEISPLIIDDNDCPLYYEWKKFYINGVELYIKLVFERGFLAYDIHGEHEN